MASSECYICRQPVKLIAKLGRKAVPRANSTVSAISRQVSGMSADNYLAEVVGPDQLHHLESRRAAELQQQQQQQGNRFGVIPSEPSQSTIRPLQAVGSTGENLSMGTPAVAVEMSQLNDDNTAPLQRTASVTATSSPERMDAADGASTSAALDPSAMPRPPRLPTGSSVR